MYLALVVKLHATKPILLYTANTFLSPAAALRQGGIQFVRQGGDSKPELRGTIDVNKGNGPDRPWATDEFLVVEPESPTIIRISFGSQGLAASSATKHFDHRLWMDTSTFVTDESYKAVLPPGVKVSWWRWASPQEVQNHMPDQMEGFSAACVAVRQWWNDKDNDAGGVPVLSDEEQVPICVDEAGVTFTCVGKHMELPGKTL
ncbi:hypothetical protein J1614_008919 [Plenodomus biglobosus]|nr:hypothetical protein J1614_008919 [Plenodomus biglobosus]